MKVWKPDEVKIFLAAARKHRWGAAFTLACATGMREGEILGLPDIRFHDHRHTAASLLLARNVDPKIVQELLGHSNISQTLDTYTHIIPTLGGLLRKKVLACM